MKASSLSTKLVLIAITTIMLMIGLSLGKGLIQSYATQLRAVGASDSTSISTMALSGLDDRQQQAKSTHWEKRDLSKEVGDRF